jgi:hypothetical protein
MPHWNQNNHINTTAVAGTTFVGNYAADGSRNIIINDGVTGGFLGLKHRSGATNAVVIAANPSAPYYASNGSMNVYVDAASPSGYVPVR